jgi:crotonobetainyl-CoA:carnitine CoA-transferase CaiB-like acyl-CoA transferase
MPDVTGPLDGILVADFSRVLAGPLAAMTLGDLGADVIKVERPDGGDDTRAWGPPWLDLDDAGDVALARELAGRADVLVESFRPGLMARWGLDGDSLRERNPRLVTCSITAFGTGAGAGLPGYDFLLQAMGGLMSITGEPDGRPLKVGSAVVDLVCGLLAVTGIQAALLERARTGRGRHVEVSLMDAALTSLLNQGSGWVAGGRVPGRLGNRHPSIVPYETFEAADRPFAVAVGNDRLFARLCEAIGRPELVADGRFATNAARVAHVDALGTLLRAAFAADDAATWVERLRAANVPAGVINGVDEAWALAEALGMEAVADIDGIPLAQPPLRLDGDRPPVRRRPPRLDEHGEEIRTWLSP